MRKPVALVSAVVLTVALVRGPGEDEAPSDVDALRGLPYLRSTGSRGGRDGVTIRDEARSCPGYTLYCILARSTAELIDERGRVVRSWTHSPSVTWENCELMPDGDLLVVGAERWAGPEGIPPEGIAEDSRYLLRLGWDSEVRWKRVLTVHHDVAVTPDDHLVVLAFERQLRPEIHPRIEVRNDLLLLLDRDGTQVDSRSFLSLVASGPASFPVRRIPPIDYAGRTWIDPFHANSVEWMHHANLVGKHPLYDPGNLLVCIRHQDRVAVVDWERRSVVWSWGEGVLSGPHDAHVLSNGNILVFDNGLARGFSRGLEVDPLSGRVVWEYRADPPRSFFTVGKGSIQRLANGNTLLAESDRGRAFEVTPSGETVWEFLTPDRAPTGERHTIVRAKRYPREHILRIATATPEERARRISWFRDVVR